MYDDILLEDSVREAQEAGLNSLKCEVKSVEAVIEKFLSQILECTSTLSERDFFVCGI
ncbi:hypothetical protein J6O86_06630 [bacterium]|nr:hypothetical protein [bacterium]